MLLLTPSLHETKGTVQSSRWTCSRCVTHAASKHGSRFTHTYRAEMPEWWKGPSYTSVWSCVPVSEHTYLLSNARAWAGWRTMLRRPSQKWSLSSGLLWRPGCFLWSTWELEFDPAGRSCPWLPGLLCLETLGWWKQTKDNQISAFPLKGFWHWFNVEREPTTSAFFF